MSMAAIASIRALIQRDVNQRGLGDASAPALFSAFPGDFHDACASLARHAAPRLAIVTGFFIPSGQPPCCETDGPLGAVFLARALNPIGIQVVIGTDLNCAKAVQAGLNVGGLRKDVPVVVLPTAQESGEMSISEYRQYFQDRAGRYTHLLAIERVGPSHTSRSLAAQGAGDALVRTFVDAVPPEHHDRCHNMRGLDITSTMSPAYRLFEHEADQDVTTIGIGDGGNEIGMGKLTWDLIRRHVPHGGTIACRIATRHLIVAGVSNWGAYGLAAGVRLLRGAEADPSLFHTDTEFDILESMVEAGPLVDGVTGLPGPTVDGLDFKHYAEVLQHLSEAGA